MSNAVVFKKNISVQISIISIWGMLVKTESLSKRPIKLLESFSTISVANLNGSLTVYLLVVNGSEMGFKNLYVGACNRDEIGLKSGH